MKLTLKNFKVWGDVSFDFKEGTTLISGMSGKGKTSILQAIIFVLFGDGKNLVSYGKKTCSVKLEYKDIIICRSKGPKRLTLIKNKDKDKDSITFEDISAQGIIDSIFGKYFQICSYISQKGAKSFLTLSPSDKLQFLGNICFDEDMEQLKEKTQATIKESKNVLMKTESNIVQLTNVLKDMRKPADHMDIPKIVKVLTIDLKEFKLRVDNMINEKIKILRIEDIDKMNSEKKTKLQEQFSLLSYQEEGDIQLNIDNIIIKINLHKLYIDVNNRNEKYLKMKSDWDKEEDDRISSLNNKIVEMEKIVISDEKRKELLEEQHKLNIDIKLCSDYNKIKDNKKKLSDKIIEYEENISNFNHRISRIGVKTVCPNCSSELMYRNNTLYIKGDEDICSDNQGDLQNNIKICEFKIRECETKLNEINNIENKIKTSQIDINNCNKRISEIQLELKNSISPSIISNLKYQLKRRENNTLKSMITGIIKDMNKCKNIEKEEEKDIKVLESSLDRYKLDLSNIKINNNRKKSLENEISSIIIDGRKWDNTKLVDLEREYTNAQLEVEENKKDIMKIKEYNMWKTEKNTYLKWEKNNSDMKKMLEHQKCRLTALQKLKDIILKAESITLKNYINSININLERYLEKFFSDNSLIVQLDSFKETKSKLVKAEINIKVLQNGIETNLSCLSGGEYDRVQLAFNLALSNMHHSPLLLLDESISSLDEVTCSKVLQSVKMTGKYSILVAHQTVEGIFDNIINV